MALNRKKALKILGDGEVRNKKLSKKQQALFGAIAGGDKPKKIQLDILKKSVK